MYRYIEPVADRLARAVSTRTVEPPSDVLLERVTLELSLADEVWQRNSWIDDPASFHRTRPNSTEVRSKSVRAGRYWFDRVTWTTGYEPHAKGVQDQIDERLRRFDLGSPADDARRCSPGYSTITDQYDFGRPRTFVAM